MNYLDTVGLESHKEGNNLSSFINLKLDVDTQ